MVAGRVEQIPLAAAVADVVWLSTVPHHISGTSAWAERRAVSWKRGGWLLVRNEFADLGAKRVGLAAFRAITA